MSAIYFEISDGSVEVGITVTELSDGTLQFDLEVLNETGVIGDLNGLFFDLADDGIAGNLEVSGTDLTGAKIDANSVTKVDSYNNVNGEVVKEDGRFDVGVQFGTQGIGEDDIQSTSFVLSSSDGTALSITDILGQDFAVRLTSVGTLDGDRDGSVKISGTSDPIVTGPVTEANDDSLSVTQNEGFDFFFGLPDPLDGGAISLFDNDTTDGGAYAGGAVETVNGQAWVDGQTYVGSNGGLLVINADGTVDFSANDQFDYLTEGQTATTQFTYTLAGGDSATIDVLISYDEGGGGIEL